MPDDKNKKPEGSDAEELASQEDIDRILASSGLDGVDADAEPLGEGLGEDVDVDALIAKTKELSDDVGPSAADELMASVLGGGGLDESGAQPMQLEDFGPGKSAGPGEKNFDLLLDVALNLKVELGRTHMPLEEILRLGEGSVVELDKLAGDPLDILVNNKLVAKGEVLVLNENFCIRITQIIEPDQRLPKDKLREEGGLS